MASADLCRLVALTYEAAIGGDADWRRLLEQLREDLVGVQAALFIQGLGSSGSRMLSLGDPDMDRAYNQHYGAVNPWFTEGSHLVRAGRVVTSDWYSPEQLRRSEFFAGFLRPQGMFHAINGFIFERPGLAGNVSVAKSWRRDGFSGDDVRLLEGLMPHLNRAIEIQRRVPGGALDPTVPLMPALDAIPYALVLTDGRGQVAFANAAGERLLADGTALRRGPGGSLRAWHPEDNTRLQRTLRAAIETGQGRGLAPGAVLRISRDGEAGPLAILVSPLRTREVVWADIPAGALVMAADPESPRTPPPAALVALYGLTPREAELASKLAAGRSLNDVAAQMGIGREAARTHLSRVLQKTDTHRQAELVRLLTVGVPHTNG